MKKYLLIRINTSEYEDGILRSEMLGYFFEKWLAEEFLESSNIYHKENEEIYEILEVKN